MKNKERYSTNYDSPDLPSSIKVLRPEIYKEGDNYFCVLGGDSLTGVAACGKTPEDAMKAWDDSYQGLISQDPRLKKLIGAIESYLIKYWNRQKDSDT